MIGLSHIQKAEQRRRVPKLQISLSQISNFFFKLFSEKTKTPVVVLGINIAIWIPESGMGGGPLFVQIYFIFIIIFLSAPAYK